MLKCCLRHFLLINHLSCTDIYKSVHVQKLHEFVNLWTNFLRCTLCCVFMVTLACLCFIVMITDEGTGDDSLFSDRQNTACYCLALLAIVSDYLQILSSVLWLIFWLVWVVWDLLEPRSNVYLLFDVSDDSTEGILERSMTTGCTPIPKIAIQEEKEDFIRKELGKASKTREVFSLFFMIFI